MSQPKMDKGRKGNTEQDVSFPQKNPHPVFQISQTKKILYANKVAQSLLRAWKQKLGRQFPKNLGLMIHETFRSGANTVVEVNFNQKAFSFSIAKSFSSSNVNGAVNDNC